MRGVVEDGREYACDGGEMSERKAYRGATAPRPVICPVRARREGL